MVRGSHNIRVGGGFRAQQMNVLTNAFQDGFNVYTNLWSDRAIAANTPQGGYNFADFMLGIPSLFIHDQTFSGATTGRRWKLFRPFVQDDWRISKDLTVNIGVAWAFVTPITEAHGRQANFDFATGKYLVAGKSPAGCTACVQTDGRVGIKMDKSAVEPRIGLAWKPFGSQKTAVRAGYAIFHDSSWNQGGQGLWENPPYFAESDFFGFTFGGCPSATAACAAATATFNPFGFGQNIATGFVPVFNGPPDPSTFTGTIQSQNLNFKQGSIQQFNFNVERQMPGNVVLTAGYAGSRSHHILTDGQNLNVSSPTACGTVPGYTLGCGIASAPYGPFTTVQATSDSGNARYDSLQVKAETKSVRNGLYALIGYTYARNFDTGFNDGLGTGAGSTYWPLPGTKKADWGLSALNVNHTFTASVIYDLPFGKGKRFGSSWSGPVNVALGNWEVDVIERVLSGFPVFVIASTNNSGVNLTNNGNNFNRPDQICKASSSHPTANAWFNASCFADAASGELGNSVRAPVYGPRFVNTDFSAVKHFRLPFREGMGLDFRAEFFNVFNHTILGVPASDVDSPGFGAISQTAHDQREVQFALKLKF